MTALRKFIWSALVLKTTRMPEIGVLLLRKLMPFKLMCTRFRRFFLVTCFVSICFVVLGWHIQCDCTCNVHDVIFLISRSLAHYKIYVHFPFSIGHISVRVCIKLTFDKIQFAQLPAHMLTDIFIIISIIPTNSKHKITKPNTKTCCRTYKFFN